MSQQAEVQIEPVIDPADIGSGLDWLDARIPLRTPRLFGAIVGETESRQRGHGTELDGIRDYVPGDEPRYIDWRVTARDPDQWPQVREHQAEITPACYIVTDTARERYAHNPGYFSEQAVALSAVMALMQLANREGMPSSLIAANDDHLFVEEQPAGGNKHILRSANLLSELSRPGERAAEASINQSGHNLTDALRAASRLCVESLVVVVSDFRDSIADKDEEAAWTEPLRTLAKHGNSLIAVELTNPWDYRLPEAADRFTIERRSVDLGGKVGQKVRQAYRVEAAAQQQTIDQSLRSVGAAHIRLSTGEPQWFSSLRSQLHELRSVAA